YGRRSAMIQNTQLVRSSSAVPVMPDPWSAPLSPAESIAQPQPIKRMQRLLRGRYGLAVTLAILGAIAGAFIGWKTQQPLYRSDGLIKVEPIANRIDPRKELM